MKNYKGNTKNMITRNFSLKELEVIGKGGSGILIKCFDEGKWEFFGLKI